MKQGLEVERVGLNHIKALLWHKNSLERNDLKSVMAELRWRAGSAICDIAILQSWRGSISVIRERERIAKCDGITWR